MNRYILLFVAFFGTFCHSVQAQETLSLSEAISNGLANNFDIQIEKQKMSAAQLNNNWGEAGMFPSINFNLSNNNTLSKNNNPTSFINGSIPSTSLNPSVSLDMTLFNGFKVRMTKSKLEKLQRESEGNADIVISNTIQAIVLGYYNAVLEKERLNVLKKNLKLSQDKYQYLKLKKELGSASTTELLLEEGNYLADSVNYLNQTYQYKRAIRNLNVVLATDNPDQEYILTESLEIPAKNFSKEALAQKLENSNVDLKKMYISQQILRQNISISRADRLPRLSLNGNYSYNSAWNDLSSLEIPITDDNDAPVLDDQGNMQYVGVVRGENQVTSINFRLSYNLFNGGRINRAIKQAVIQENIGEMRIDKMKTTLRKDLYDAFDLYTIRKNLMEINSRKRMVAESNLSLNEEKYKNGSINSFDYRRIQMNALQAEFEELQAKYSLINSNLNLMRLTGGILENYKQ